MLQFGMMLKTLGVPMTDQNESYILDDQVGFLLRLAYQRHIALFMEQMTGGLTPPQFSTLYRLREAVEPISQNALGRLVGMDAATTKGVVARLLSRDLIRVEKDGGDRRRYTLFITDAGRQLLDAVMADVKGISEATLEPLAPQERAQFLALLKRLI
ncbi:MarR family transcriptional regulator [Rhizobium sp. FY34]|uniref:MarR family winged helix-turn-helix transcriptional regulator n=1 Tax=Rhizobium sp. FY34 TaxID=2562309 RepID=UPI001FED8775|nr:MarR family transcriptional regulator [Rhizobium sp. FY34]